jgi:hypothetical protein
MANARTAPSITRYKGEAGRIKSTKEAAGETDSVALVRQFERHPISPSAFEPLPPVRPVGDTIFLNRWRIVLVHWYPASKRCN